MSVNNISKNFKDTNSGEDLFFDISNNHSALK